MKCIYRILFISTIIALFLSSCIESNNQIYFDEKTSCIKSEYNSPVSRLSIIVSNADTDYEIFEIENQTDKKDKSIYLRDIPSKYKIENGRKQTKLFVKKKFGILPNSKYTIINHSYGGAAVGIIYLCSDSTGNLYSIKE